MYDHHRRNMRSVLVEVGSYDAAKDVCVWEKGLWKVRQPWRALF